MHFNNIHYGARNIITLSSKFLNSETLVSWLLSFFFFFNKLLLSLFFYLFSFSIFHFFIFRFLHLTLIEFCTIVRICNICFIWTFWILVQERGVDPADLISFLLELSFHVMGEVLLLAF